MDINPESRLRFWALVPAAGIGSRMGTPVPKQYLPLAGRTVLDYAVSRLVAHPACAGGVVVLSADDRRWAALAPAAAAHLATVVGGSERCQSVLNGLEALATRARPGDWVLVHDAARPCLHPADLDTLLATLADDPVGGLLALPVRDTMKRVDGEGRVRETVSREGLWHALTPQMFRLGPLTAALRSALARGELVTDEARAMELAGHRPRLVEGRPDNIKITRASDLALAERYIQWQENE